MPTPHSLWKQLGTALFVLVAYFMLLAMFTRCVGLQPGTIQPQRDALVRVAPDDPRVIGHHEPLKLIDSHVLEMHQGDSAADIQWTDY